MVPAASQARAHDHARHDHGRSPPHPHAHGPSAPHPVQAASWSILRMTVAARLLAALALCALLWGVVWLAMR